MTTENTPTGDLEVFPERKTIANFVGYGAHESAVLGRGYNKCLDDVTPIFTRLTAQREGLLAEIERLKVVLSAWANDRETHRASDIKFESELNSVRELLIDIRGANAAYALQKIDIYLSQLAAIREG